jgi:hypothetical protein
VIIAFDYVDNGSLGLYPGRKCQNHGSMANLIVIESAEKMDVNIRYVHFKGCLQPMAGTTR